MRRKAFLLLVMIAMLTAIALTACGSAASFPTGKFVSENDQAVTWEFKPDGTFTNLSAAGLPIEGSYTVSGSTYTETDNNTMPNDPSCATTKPTYTWSYDGSKLSFKVVSDACKERVERYTGSALVPQK